MTQDDLAVKTGYSDKSAISHLEKGELDPPQSKIVALAEALKTTPSYLIDGYDVETIYNQIQSMDDFDRMVLINRLIKDNEKKKTFLDILKEEHSGAYVTVDEVHDLIEKALAKSEAKKMPKKKGAQA